MTQTDTKYSMAQLRATKKSLFIRNNGEFLWKLSKLGLELRPFGQRGSIAHLTQEALDNADVLRNLAHGNVTISPDLEQEMFDLETGRDKTTVKDSMLSELKAEVITSSNRRALDVKDQTDGYLDTINRKRVNPQGQTLGSSVEEFINPVPIRRGEVLVDPKTGTVIDETPLLDITNLKYTIERKVVN